MVARGDVVLCPAVRHRERVSQQYETIGFRFRLNQQRKTIYPEP